MNTITQTVLELFPIEIILIVFKYFDIRDLYQSFYGLNSRFDAIVGSKSNLSLILSTPDEVDDPFFDLFTAHIVKLIIDHSSSIDLEPFSSLHSLIFNSPSDEQLEQLWLCEFPHLIHLEFGIMSNALSHRALCKFLHCEQFPMLKTCIFHHETNAVSSNRYRQIWSNSSTLRFSSLDLSLCSDHGLITGEKLSSVDVTHFNLTRMDLCYMSDGPSMSEIDHFLQRIPNLERFRISSNEIYHSYEFLQRLASILQRRLIHLQQFDCDLQCVMTAEELAQISRLHPCFHRIQYEFRYDGQCVTLSTE